MNTNRIESADTRERLPGGDEMWGNDEERTQMNVRGRRIGHNDRPTPARKRRENMRKQAKICPTRELNKTQKAVVDLLRRGEPMTYDRIAETIGMEPRGIYQSALRPLERDGIIIKQKGGNTIHGRTGALFGLDEIRFPKGSLPHEQSLFDVSEYRQTPMDIVRRGITNIAQGTPTRTVAIHLINRLATITMSDGSSPERMFRIMTMTAPTRRTGVLSADVRNRVYEEIRQRGERGATRAEVTTATAISSSSVIPRIRELLDQGYVVEAKSDTKSARRIIAKHQGTSRLTSSDTNTYRDGRVLLVDEIANVLENQKNLSNPEKLHEILDSMIREFIKRHAIEERNAQTGIS